MTRKEPGDSVVPLDIRLFGKWSMDVQGRPLPRLRSRAGQSLLALLILRAGQPTERAWLAATLWPDSDEEQALYNLRRNLTDLRGALGEEAARLEAPTSRSLELNLSGCRCDLLAFDAVCAAVPAASDEDLARAVALYRGPLLEEFTEEWAYTERQARAQAYLNLLETLAEREASARNWPEAIRYLRLAVAAEPFQETAQHALIETLAFSGERAAAMLAYREFRLLLHEQLQTEPAPQTQALYQKLRSGEGSEALKRADAASVPPREAAGRAPAVHTSTSLHIPRSVSALVGREQETKEIMELLSSARLVTLTGTGGVGKTRLALRVAEQVVERFPDGIWFVDLAPLTEAAEVLPAAAAALLMREQPGRSLMDTLSAFLAEKELLLILDNCEHLVDACAHLTAALLQSSPKLRILATSRQPLGFPGERAWRVPSLALPEALPPVSEEMPAESLLQWAGTRLFVERALETSSAFALTGRSASAAVDICRRLDGIPLAIELAAARVKVLSVEQIAVRLEDTFRLLTSGNRAALPRQQTLRALIDWSYDLLSESEKILLRRLSVFAGGWTLEAAENVCGNVECRVWSGGEEGESPTSHGHHSLTPSLHHSTFLEEGEILDLLAGLVDKSLVIAGEQGEQKRYRLLETVRQYAREKLATAGEEQEYRRLHRDFYLELAAAMKPKLTGPEQSRCLEVLETEHANLRQALAFCRQFPQEMAQGLRLAASLWLFWQMRGHFSEGRDYLMAFLASPLTQEHTRIRAEALNGAGVLAWNQSDYSAARELYENCLTIWRELEDRQGIAASLNNLGNLAWNQRDYASARALYEEAQTIFRERGDRQSLANSLNNLGLIACVQNDYAPARSFFRESLALLRELGDRRGTAYSLNNLGIMAWNEKDYDAARSLYEESLSINRELGNRSGIAYALNNLGIVAQAQKDYEAARALFEECLTLQQELGNKMGIANSFGNLGDIASLQSDYAGARSLYRESLLLRRDLEDRLGLANSLEAFAGLAVREGKQQQGARLWGAAERLREEIGTPLAPNDREEYDHSVEAARRALGEETFLASWKEGREMTVEQAVRSVLEETFPV